MDCSSFESKKIHIENGTSFKHMNKNYHIECQSFMKHNDLYIYYANLYLDVKIDKTNCNKMFLFNAKND